MSSICPPAPRSADGSPPECLRTSWSSRETSCRRCELHDKRLVGGCQGACHRPGVALPLADAGEDPSRARDAVTACSTVSAPAGVGSPSVGRASSARPARAAVPGPPASARNSVLARFVRSLPFRPLEQRSGRASRPSDVAVGGQYARERARACATSHPSGRTAAVPSARLENSSAVRRSPRARATEPSPARANEAWSRKPHSPRARRRGGTRPPPRSSSPRRSATHASKSTDGGWSASYPMLLGVATPVLGHRGDDGDVSRAGGNTCARTRALTVMPQSSPLTPEVGPAPAPTSSAARSVSPECAWASDERDLGESRLRAVQTPRWRARGRCSPISIAWAGRPPPSRRSRARRAPRSRGRSGAGVLRGRGGECELRRTAAVRDALREREVPAERRQPDRQPASELRERTQARTRGCRARARGARPTLPLGSHGARRARRPPARRSTPRALPARHEATDLRQDVRARSRGPVASTSYRTRHLRERDRDDGLVDERAEQIDHCHLVELVVGASRRSPGRRAAAVHRDVVEQRLLVGMQEVVAPRDERRERRRASRPSPAGRETSANRRSTTERSSARPNTLTRAAASSIASGMPSTRRLISAATRRPRPSARSPGAPRALGR